MFARIDKIYGWNVNIAVLLIIILFLAVLACRMYCRKRNRHKTLRFMISRIHPLRVTPIILQSPPHFGRARRTMSTQLEATAPPLSEFLPETTNPSTADTVTTPQAETLNENEDQISLESHMVPHDSTIHTADEIKSPPPPYSAEDLPSYEEAIRWSTQNKSDSIHDPS